jgi:diacylglycerol O-acyltransferase / wax synthase
MTPPTAANQPSSRFDRLNPLDLMFLAIEREDWPCHFGGLAVLDGAALLDNSRRVRLDEMVERLDRRVATMSQLRRRLLYAGLGRGRPLWIDDERFDVRDHVFETSVAGPGGDRELLDRAAELCGRLLDRHKPLWELWFLTGLRDGRIGVLLKLHHAVADGMAAVELMASLFDEAADDEVPPALGHEPPPTGQSLAVDNLTVKARRVGRVAGAAAAHPLRAARHLVALVAFAREVLTTTKAPRTSLNQRVRAGIRVEFIRLDLDPVKKAAHERGGKANDVVLELWTGGLRRLLLARGEDLAGKEPVSTVPTSLRPAGDPGRGANELGAISIALPAWEPDAQRRLDLIVARTRTAKLDQHPAAAMGLLAAVTRTPLGPYLATHQRTVNVEVTNVAGPPLPLHLFGAEVRAILPIVGPVGNMGPILCAFSYAGQLFLVVTADARTFLDLDVLMTGMAEDAHVLLGEDAADEG